MCHSVHYDCRIITGYLQINRSEKIKNYDLTLILNNKVLTFSMKFVGMWPKKNQK